jgi:type IV pilus assembly protein PilZ
MTNQKITCAFKDLKSLYMAHMPFLKNGGLFIRTDQDIAYGDMVDLEITFPGEKQPKIFEGKVIWKIFADAQDIFHAGVGIQFEGEQAHQANDLIRKYLVSFTDLELATDTM